MQAFQMCAHVCVCVWFINQNLMLFQLDNFSLMVNVKFHCENQIAAALFNYSSAWQKRSNITFRNELFSPTNLITFDGNTGSQATKQCHACECLLFHKYIDLKFNQSFERFPMPTTSPKISISSRRVPVNT